MNRITRAAAMAGNGTGSRLLRALGGAALATLLGLGAGCAPLLAPSPQEEHLYVLAAEPPAQTTPDLRDEVVLVSLPRVQPGFETSRIAYVRKPFQIEYFALSRWAETPSRMLAPLIVRALQRTFRTVVQAPSPVSADLRLDTELVRLQQDFRAQPSRFEVGLRAQLIDIHRGRVLATRQFDAAENAPRDDPYGGVVAANRALQRVLAELTQFCAETPR